MWSAVFAPQYISNRSHEQACLHHCFSSPIHYVHVSTIIMSVTFSRGELVFDLNIEGSSYTAAQIARMLEVEPDTVWLKETFGTRTFFPRPETQDFDLSTINVRSCPSIDVMGRSIVTNTGRTQPVPQNTLQPMTFSAIPTSSNSANGSSSSYAGFSSVVAKRKSSDGSFSVKIVQARMTKSKAGGKIEFQRTGQAYFFFFFFFL